MSDDPYYARLRASLASDAAAAAAHLGDAGLRDELARQDRASDDYRPPDTEVRHVRITGPHGDIPVRVYTPRRPGSDRPLLIWCHGGGWHMGDLDMPEAAATSQEVCDRADAVVVSVDYRLARDGVHYPVPLDDVTAAALWATRHAPMLGASPARVALGGASAGANLAAGAVLRLRDEAAPLPALLVLAYPVLHAALPEPFSPDVAGMFDRLRLSAGLVSGVLTPLVENYLGSGIAAAPDDAMPGQSDLEGFPPTLILECEWDPLRASSEAFADGLRARGVPIERRLVLGVQHALLNRPGTPQAQDAYALIAQRVRDGIRRTDPAIRRT